MNPGDKVVFSPRAAPHVRRYGTYIRKGRDGYVVVCLEGETENKYFPESEVTRYSLLERLAEEVQNAEEADELGRE